MNCFACICYGVNSVAKLTQFQTAITSCGRALAEMHTRSRIYQHAYDIVIPMMLLSLLYMCQYVMYV